MHACDIIGPSYVWKYKISKQKGQSSLTSCTNQICFFLLKPSKGSHFLAQPDSFLSRLFPKFRVLRTGPELLCRKKLLCSNTMSKMSQSSQKCYQLHLDQKARCIPSTTQQATTALMASIESQLPAKISSVEIIIGRCFPPTAKTASFRSKPTSQRVPNQFRQLVLAAI